MKPILCLILMLSLNVSAQIPSIEKTWIAKDHTRIKFEEEVAHLSLSEYGFSSNFRVLNDTLRFVEVGSANPTEHDYKMILSRDSLILTPLNTHSNILQSGQKSISFIDRNLIVDEHFDFKSLKFRDVGGNWEWKDFSLEIAKNGQLKVKVQKDGYHKPALYYQGKLKKNQLAELIEILKRSEIDRLSPNQKYVHHGTTITLDIHYNNKSKYLQQQYFPPTFWELASYLNKLPEATSLKASKPFEIFPPDPVIPVDSVLKALPALNNFN